MHKASAFCAVITLAACIKAPSAAPDAGTAALSDGGSPGAADAGNNAFPDAGMMMVADAGQVFLDPWELPFDAQHAYAAWEIAPGDVDGNGKLDIVLSVMPPQPDGTPSSLVSLLGMGDGTFMWGPVTEFTGSAAQQNIHVGDLDGDGMEDVLGGPVARSSGGGAFEVHEKLRPGVDFDGGTVAFADVAAAFTDFNLDGVPDLLLGGGRGIELYEGGTLPLVPRGHYQTDDTIQSLVTADLDGDGRKDVVAYESAPFNPHLRTLLTHPDGTLAAGSVFSISNFGQGMVAGDFNGDGKQDVAIPSGSGVFVLPGQGDGSFGAMVTSPLLAGHAVVAGDFNGDGALDLAGMDGAGTGAVIAVLLGDGAGHFNARLTLPGWPVRLMAGDFNHDGRMDLAALMGSTSSVSVFLARP